MTDEEKEKLKDNEEIKEPETETETVVKTEPEPEPETQTGSFLTKEEFDSYATEMATKMDLMQATIDGFNPVIQEEKEENEDEHEEEIKSDENVSHETSESDLEEMDKFLNS